MQIDTANVVISVAPGLVGRHHLVLLFLFVGLTITASCSDPSQPTPTPDTKVPLYHSELEVDVFSFTVDDQANLHITQFWESDVLKYSSDGTLLDRWFVIERGDTLRVDALTGVDSTLVMLVQSNVMIFDENHSLIASWPEQHSRNVTSGGDLLDADVAGNLYVLDDNRDLVVKYGPDGQFEREWRIEHLDSLGNGGLGGIAVTDAGRVFVSDAWRHRVHAFAADGRPLFEFGEFGYRPGEMNGPRGLDISGGILYVADLANFRVQMFTLHGNYLNDFYSRGTYGRGLDPPESVDVHGSHVFVMHENSIIRFDYTD